MTRQEQFIENCKKLIDGSPSKYQLGTDFRSDDYGFHLKDSDGAIFNFIPFYRNSTEGQLRQLIYHEFEYDVELIFFQYKKNEIHGCEVVCWNYEKNKDGIRFRLDGIFKPDLSHWTDALMEVFNKLMEDWK